MAVDEAFGRLARSKLGRASGKDINILIVDTAVCSNTGEARELSEPSKNCAAIVAAPAFLV